MALMVATGLAVGGCASGISGAAISPACTTAGNTTGPSPVSASRLSRKDPQFHARPSFRSSRLADGPGSVLRLDDEVLQSLLNGRECVLEVATGRLGHLVHLSRLDVLQEIPVLSLREFYAIW